MANSLELQVDIVFQREGIGITKLTNNMVDATKILPILFIFRIILDTHI